LYVPRLDRIDQDALPLNGAYSPGPLTGSGVHVYIIDTGLYAESTEFSGRVGQSVNCVGGSCSTSTSWNDGNGHGTHVAGTVGGTCYGVAKQATIHAVKALGDDGSGSFSGIVAGLRWVKAHVQANGWKGVTDSSLWM
jgi:subtilisin family serine protease